MDEKNDLQEEQQSENMSSERQNRYAQKEEEFQTTYFPRRDRSDTMYYGQNRKKSMLVANEYMEFLQKEAELVHTQIPKSHNKTEDETLTKTQYPTKIREKKKENTQPKEIAPKPQRQTSADRPVHKKTKRKRKRKMTKGFKAILFLLIAVLVCFVCFRFAKGLMMTDGSEENLTGQTVSITIPAGASTADIAKILKENDLISSTITFRLSSKINGYDGTYQQGTYDVDTGMTNTQIMALLQTGSVQNENKITIPEGFTVKQIAQRVEEKGICTADAFIEEVNNGTFPHTFLKDLPKREYRLEGYLFPDTYFLTKETTAHDLISMMLDRFEQMYTTAYQDAVATSGHTLDEIVRIASMIEKEISLDEERAKASGVIYNRLQQNMSLGIDATVLYAVGKTGGELTKEDLETDSPYNTRVNKGLPLGPIANPGEASFKAALYPEKNEYLYYVVEAEGKSNHVFCKTNEEFLAAKEKYKASLTQ